MSWFRWRQTDEDEHNFVSSRRRETLFRPIGDKQNEANNNRQRRQRGSKLTTLIIRQTEVRNEQELNDVDQHPPPSWPLLGRESPARVVPRLVSLRRDYDERGLRTSCQLATMNQQQQDTTSQLLDDEPRRSHLGNRGLRAEKTKKKKKTQKKEKRRPDQMGTTSNLLAMLTCSLLLCLTVALAQASGKHQQRFDFQPEPQYLVHNGREIRLGCLVSHRQGECLWLRNGRGIGIIPKKYGFLREPLDGDCSLIIRNATVQLDDGQWQCQVTPSDLEQETLLSREIQLVVLVPPERPQIKNATSVYSGAISVEHKLLVLEERSPASVVCEVRGGNPTPQIEWILDGKNITKEASQSSAFLGQPQGSQTQTTSQRITQSRLRMSDIRRTMNGKNLTCVGVHQTGSQSSSVELDVQYIPSVSVPQREYSIVEGSPLSVSCQVDSNPPPSEVGWRLSPASDASGKHAPIKQGALLNFERTSRELNQNTFQCFAQNSYGISTPAEVKLNVLYAPTALNISSPESVLVGSEAQLSCLFEGNPRPEIRWLFTDPLSRSPGPQLIDNPDKKQAQHLLIKNVTYRNEGDYHCEARNQINGQEFYMRSSNIILDVFGEPQFLVRSPFVTKAIQGTKSDISLTFCSDPPPNRVFWYFGSMRLDVRLNTTTNNGQQSPPVMQLAHSGGANSKQPHIYQRFQAHPLQALQTRNSSLGLPATCFEAKLTILDPELTDQRDFSLMVSNEKGHTTGIIRLRIGSPLSPMLMISSAFVTICGLFLLSLVVIFLLKRRHDSAAANLQNGTGCQQSGEKGAGSVEHLVNVNHVNGNTNGLLQQTRGIVNGTGNGLANGAANPATNAMLAEEAAKLHHNLMSMASSDTSGDQKQLLTNSSSDRNSPVSGSTNNTNTCVDFNLGSSSNGSVGHSSSTPSPLNHISVEHEFHHHHHNHHDDDDGSTYQPAESVTNCAELSPHSPLSRHANSALIYANLEYSEQHPSMVADMQHSPHSNHRTPSQQSRLRQQVPVAYISMAHSPTGSTSTADSRLHPSSSIRRSVANRASLSSSGGGGGGASSSGNNNDNSNEPQPSPKGRPSVGATIAMMNSLAAAAASSSNPNPNPNANLNPNPSMSSPSTGVLNGAIQQQLASNKQLRKPGPPKPPKPSIQQRSRFYQQHLAASNNNSGSSSLNNSSVEGDNNNLVMIGSRQPSATGSDQQATTNDQLAAEYSRIAFPARAEL